MPSSPLTLSAPAKLNLYLHVTGRRDDGYHLLDSLVAFADICDVLTIAPASSLEFSADGPFAFALGEDHASNLVVRAARMLAAAFERSPDFALRLTKNLPVASGIGGGSTDAAACLRGLASCWGLDPAAPVLRRIAADLGSDVPACFDGRACYMGGIGVDLSPAPPLPSAGVVLVNPGVALPTPSVYRARQGGFSPAARFATSPANAVELGALLSRRTNDLTAAAITLAPEIATALEVIGSRQGCLVARMSGSGATCFGLFQDAAAAAEAASRICSAYPTWWVAAGRLIEDVRALAPDYA